MQLFRQQAIDHQHRLYGEVLLVQQLPWRAIVGLLLALIASFTLFLFFGTYSRTVSASGVMDRDGQIALSVPAAAIPQIMAGQPVRIAPDASPSSDRRIITGVVTSVTAEPAESHSQVMTRVAPGIGLRPGQPLQAHILLGQRSLFQWLAGTGDTAARP